MLLPTRLYLSTRFVLKSYQWLKDKIVSEDGRKQQAKLKELGHIAEKLGCTLPQLAVGKAAPINTSNTTSHLTLYYCPLCQL